MGSNAQDSADLLMRQSVQNRELEYVAILFRKCVYYFNEFVKRYFIFPTVLLRTPAHLYHCAALTSAAATSSASAAASAARCLFFSLCIFSL